MDNFKDEDIILFCESYKQHILENPLLNSKIPVWVEYLKTKKHYRENGMEEDYFFKKRFGLTQDDLMTIHKLIDRVKRGKTLTSNSKSRIQGTDGSFGSAAYCGFDENENYDDKQPQFELMGQVQSALDDYNKKMKKAQVRKNWKQSSSTRAWEPNGCVDSEPDRYYTEDMYSSRPQVEFDVQDFARTQMYNMNKTNIVQQIDNINNILDSNDLITNDFDTEYKRAVPSLSSKKKVQFTNKIDGSIGNNNINQQTNQQTNQFNFSNGMVSGLSPGLGMDKVSGGGPESTRLWQDLDILNARGNTRNSAIPNRNAFEHQFDYLDGNYNRVPDPRILGTSSRLENRSTFKR